MYRFGMSENLRTYTKAIFGLDHVVRLVPADAWSNASPCSQWTARDVLGHVIGIQRWIETLALGTQATIDPWDNPGQVAGDDPAAAWASVRDAVLAALDAPGVLNRVIESFVGLESIDTAIGWNVVDTTVHTWDIARAAGVDEAIDPALVAHVAAQVEPRVDHLRESTFIGAPAECPPDADSTTRLLALLGRAV